MSRVSFYTRPYDRLEPYDGKLSRTVLRGGTDSNVSLLPDNSLIFHAGTLLSTATQLPYSCAILFGLVRALSLLFIRFTRINRTTFYNHYDGTYEVLAEIEENFLAELSGGEDSAAKNGNLVQHIEALCTRLQQNAEIAILLLNNNVDPQFSQKLLSGQGLGGVWKQLGNIYTAAERELLADFLRGGAYAMVCRWLVGGCRQTPKQIAALLAKAIENGVKIHRSL